MKRKDSVLLKYYNNKLPKHQNVGVVGYKDMQDKSMAESIAFLKDWYTKRATLPQFKDVSERRLSLLEKPVKTKYLDPELMYGQGFAGSYRPINKTLFLANPDLSFGDFPEYKSYMQYNSGSPLMTHELSHKLQYEAPSFVSVVPGKRTNLVKSYPGIGAPEYISLKTGKVKYNSKKDTAKFYPELESVTAMLRQAEGIDPTKPLTSEDVNNYINKYQKYKEVKMGDVPEKDVKEYHRGSVIQDLFEALGNDPENIANYLNSVAKNDTQDLSMARYGRSVNYYGPGGQTTDGCPAYYHKNAQGQCVPIFDFKMPTNYSTDRQQVVVPMQENLEIQNKLAQQKAEARRQFVGPTRFQTDDEKKKNLQKKRNYVATHPNTKLDSNNNIVTINSDRDMEGRALPHTPAAKTDRGMNALATGLDAAGYVTQLGLLGKLAKGALTKSIESRLLSNPTLPTLKLPEVVSTVDDVPESLMIKARGLFAKEPMLGKQHFWTDAELENIIKNKKLQNELFKEYEKLGPTQSPKDLNEIYPWMKEKWDKLITNAPKFTDKFFNPAQEQYIRSMMPWYEHGLDARNMLSKKELTDFVKGISKKPLSKEEADFLKALNIDINDPFFQGYIKEGVGNLKEFSPIERPNSLFGFGVGRMNRNGGVVKYGPGGATTDGCPPNYFKDAQGRCVPEFKPNFRMSGNYSTDRQQVVIPKIQNLRAAQQAANFQKEQERQRLINSQTTIGQSRSDEPWRQKQAADIRRKQAQENSALAQTMGSFTPSGSNSAAGAIGAEAFTNMNPLITGPMMSTSRLYGAGRSMVDPNTYNPYFGSDKGAVGNFFGALNLAGDITMLRTALRNPTGNFNPQPDPSKAVRKLSDFTERNARVKEAWFNNKKQQAGIPTSAEEYRKFLQNEKLRQQAGDVLRRLGTEDPTQGGMWQAPKDKLTWKDPKTGEIRYELEAKDYENFKTPELYKQAQQDFRNYKRGYWQNLIDQRNAAVNQAKKLGFYEKEFLTPYDPKNFSKKNLLGGKFPGFDIPDYMENLGVDMPMYLRDRYGAIHNMSGIENPEQMIPYKGVQVTQGLSPNRYGGSTNQYGPGGSTTDGCPAGYNKHPLTGQCIPAPNISNLIKDNSKPTILPFKTRSQQVKEATDDAIQRSYKIGKYGQNASIGQGRQQTIDEQRLSEQRKRNYAAQRPYSVYNEQTGNLESRYPDRNMEGNPLPYSRAYYNDRGMTTFAHGLEAASYLTGAGELAGAGYNAAKKALAESMESGLLSNTYKLNPWRFKPNPNAYYHRSPNLENIINRETGTLQGFGQSEAGQAYSELARPGMGNTVLSDGRVSRINLRKPANSSLYFSKGVPLDYGRYNPETFNEVGKRIMTGQGYPGPYIVEVEGVPMGASIKGRLPGAEPKGLESYAVSKRPISLNESKFYKENWLRGYKEVPKPTIGTLPPSQQSGLAGNVKEMFTNPKQYFTKAGPESYTPNYENIAKSFNQPRDPFAETIQFGTFTEGPRVLDWSKIGKTAAGVGIGSGLISAAGKNWLKESKKKYGGSRFDEGGQGPCDPGYYYDVTAGKCLPLKATNLPLNTINEDETTTPIEQTSEEKRLALGLGDDASTNESLKQGTAGSDNFLKNWYRQRTDDPRYGKVAQQRVAEISKIQETPTTAADLKKQEAAAYYIGGGKKIYIDPNNPYSRGSTTQTHEKTHEVYDQVPQPNQNNIIKSLIVGEKNWNKYLGDYNYYSQPTEVAARLNQFRKRYNIDPNKKYTPEEMKAIIDAHKNRYSSGVSSEDMDVDQQSGDINIDQLFNIIGDDPAKLAELNDRIVMNQQAVGADMAKWGGLVKYQNRGQVKTLPPIYTDDPRKVKAYKDSLNEYKSGERWANLVNTYERPYEGVNAISESDLNKVRSIIIKEFPQIYSYLTQENKPISNYPYYVNMDNNQIVGPIITNLFKKPVQPYILQKEPTLKRKVSKMEPMRSSYTPSLSIRTIQTPDIELPGIQMGKYRTSYWDPEMKDWNERSFMSQQESDQFANEMSQRGYAGPYGNVTQRVQYRNGGLTKYQIKGQVGEPEQPYLPYRVDYTDPRTGKSTSKYYESAEAADYFLNHGALKTVGPQGVSGYYEKPPRKREVQVSPEEQARLNKQKDIEGTTKSFLENWYNSPMHREMLKNSLNRGLGLFLNKRVNKMTQDRLKTIPDIRVNLQELPEGTFNINDTRLEGYVDESNPSLINITPFTPLENAKSTGVHEGSHTADYLASIPIKDVKRMRRAASVPTDDYGEYIIGDRSGTETKARIYEGRYNLEKAGIYNPFKEKLSRENFERAEKEVPEFKRINDDLRSIYSTDDIYNFYNTISKSDNSKTQTMARYGFSVGPKQNSLTKYQSIGEVTGKNCRGECWKPTLGDKAGNSGGMFLGNDPLTWAELQPYAGINLNDKKYKQYFKELQQTFPGLTKEQFRAAGADTFRIKGRIGDLSTWDKPENQTYDRAWYPFYRSLMKPNVPLTIPQILEFQSQQPGGLGGYQQVVESNYGKKKLRNGGENYLDKYQKKGQVTKKAPITHYVFAEQNPDNAFNKEAENLKSYISKNYPGENVVILPGRGDEYFNKTVLPTLQKVGKQDRVYLFGHHGSNYAGVPASLWGNAFEKAQQRAGDFNCYLGSCGSSDLAGALPEEERMRQDPAFSRLKNFYYRPNLKFNNDSWYGVNPNAKRTTDDSSLGVLNALYTRTAYQEDYEKKHNDIRDKMFNYIDKANSSNSNRIALVKKYDELSEKLDNTSDLNEKIRIYKTELEPITAKINEIDEKIYKSKGYQSLKNQMVKLDTPYITDVPRYPTDFSKSNYNPFINTDLRQQYLNKNKEPKLTNYLSGNLFPKFNTGGIIEDDMGQLKYPGVPTRVRSKNITMEQVSHPLVAKTNRGITKLLLPNMKYEFEPMTQFVDEHPVPIIPQTSNRTPTVMRDFGGEEPPRNINLSLPKMEQKRGKVGINPYIYYDKPNPNVNIMGAGFQGNARLNKRWDLTGGMNVGRVSVPSENFSQFLKPNYNIGLGFRFAKGGQHGGLDRWFAEKWVDVKTGKTCGRQEGENRGYPACRPSKRISSQTPKTSSEMSSSEKAKFKSVKQSSQRIPYNHKRR